MGAVQSPARGRVLQAAVLVTELTSPAICAAAGLIVVAWHSAADGHAAAWAGLAVLLCAGIPISFIAKGVKAGRWSDHHVGQRDQRAVPLLVGLISVAAAAVLLAVLHAPRDLTALVLSQLIGLTAVSVITRFWKVSIHCATAGGLVGILVVLFGPWALTGLALLALVARSRVVLDAHTWPQVLVGSLVGFAVAIAAFPVLR